MDFKDYQKAEKKYNIGSMWMTLLEGDNKVRIITPFEDYGNHYNPTTNKSTICLGKDKDCYFCQQGFKPTVKFLGWVIDRADGQMKLLRVGYQIYKQIGILAKSEQYQFSVIPSYDMTIQRTGTGKETEYNVVADRKDTPLTKEEEEMIKDEKYKPPEDIVKGMKSKVFPVKVDKAEVGVENPSGEEEIDVKDLPY